MSTQNLVENDKSAKLEKAESPSTPKEGKQLNAQSESGIKSTDEKESGSLNKFCFKPIEVFLINKMMPGGIKLDNEEDFLKFLEQAKRARPPVKAAERLNKKTKLKKSNDETSNNAERVNSRKKIGQSSSKIFSEKTAQISPEKKKVRESIEKYLEKIKAFKGVGLLNKSNDENLTLESLEEEVRKYSFESVYEFFMRFRKMIGVMFKLYLPEPQNYRDLVGVGEKFENLVSDSVKPAAKTPEKPHHSLTSKPQKNHTKETSAISHSNVRPMSIQEKNDLGNAIRSLNREQLRGIIKILSDPRGDNQPKKGFFEFDIDKLSAEKLRDLQKYVNSCTQKKAEEKKESGYNTETQKNRQLTDSQSKSQAKPQSKSNQPQPKDTEKKQETSKSKDDSLSDSSMSENSSLSSLDEN